MSVVTGTIRGRATVVESQTPKIYNVSIPTANTEVSQLLSSDVKQFTIKVRGSARLQLAFNSGESGTTFITVPTNANYTASALNFSGTLYFQTNKDTQIVEILEWT